MRLTDTPDMATLYLVATPIGNLQDITLRALEILRIVDVVASEDTRKTGRLLKHFEIDAQQVAFHEHNEERAGARILGLLRTGQSVALVTNAGTPGISDPGFTLVRKVLQANSEPKAASEGEAEIAITMAPGASAVVMAVVLSGLPVHSFTFKGFPPRKRGARLRFLEQDAQSPHTLVIYESPYRLAAFLQDAITVYGDRQAALANDLTKLYERVDRGKLSDLHMLVADKKLKGEYVVVIAGSDA